MTQSHQMGKPPSRRAEAVRWRHPGIGSSESGGTGTVVLEGRVRTWPEKQAILGVVSHAAGVRADPNRAGAPEREPAEPSNLMRLDHPGAAALARDLDHVGVIDVDLEGLASGR